MDDELDSIINFLNDKDFQKVVAPPSNTNAQNNGV